MGMNYLRGRSFVTIMIIIAIFSLLLRIAIKRIIKINIIQNESQAQTTLKLISAALENYAKDHLGTFPINLFILTKNNPPYLDKNYISASPLRGYEYSCLRLEASGYSCSAVPIQCELSAGMTYTISTGGLLISENCSKKE